MSRCIVEYYQRAFDSGTSGLVYWISLISPNSSPVTTTPQFTGTLSNYVIMARIKKDVF